MNFLNPYAPQIKSILRIAIGLVFLGEGIAKLFHFPAGSMFDHVNWMTWPEGASGVVEFFGGALVTLGFFSRYAAFICSGEMAVAYFMVHWAIFSGAPHSFFPVVNGGAAAIVYCFLFLYFAASGPGAIALNQK